MINKLLSHIDYKTLFNSIGEGIVYIDIGGTIAFLNKAAEEMFAPASTFRTGETIYRQSWRLFTKSNDPLPAHEFPAIIVLETGRCVHNTILKIILQAGQTVWFDINADPVAADDGSGAAGVILTIVDLTETMTEKQRLRLNEEKYRTFFLSSKSATFLATKAGEYLDVSLGAEAIFGYSVEELKQLGRDGIVVQDESFRAALQQRDEKGSVVAVVNGRRKGGTVFPMIWHANLFTTSGGEELVSVMMVDLTEKVELEKQVQESKFNLDLVMENSGDGIAVLDTNYIVQSFNEPLNKAMQITHGHQVAVGDCLLDILSDDRKPYLVLRFAEVLQGQKKELTFEGVSLQGKPLVFFSTLLPLYKNGKVVGIFILSKDVTQTFLANREAATIKARLERAALASYDIISEHNLQTREVTRNAAFKEILGYEDFPDQELPDSMTALVHPDDRSSIKALLADKLHSDETFVRMPVFRALHKDGHYVYLESRLLITRNENGEPLLLTSVTSDVSDYIELQKKLIESNQAFQRATDTSYDIITERNLKIGTVKRNEAFRSVLGYDVSNFPELSDARELVHPDDREKVFKTISEQVALKKSNFKLPVHRLRHSDGHYVYVDTRMMITRNEQGEPYLSTMVSSDVTEFLQLQQSLVVANEELKKQTEDLKHSNAELERFAYVASHDLQEPLRMVSSFLSLLKKRYDALLDDAGRQYIHFAVDGAARMKKLIQDLLQFSRIGSGKETKEPVNTADLVDGLLDEFVFTIDEKKAKVSTTGLPVVYAAKSSLTHIFQNLIGNALKYSERPEIEIGAEEEKKEWKFYVKDNGIGIDPKFFDKIFVLFQQLHTKSESSGTGIGLAIVKKIIDQSGGRIWVDSALGTGSTFFFTVPKNQTNNA